MKKDKNISSKRTTNVVVKKENAELFNRENYKWMIIGAVVIIIGFFLMAGGKSSDPQIFQPDVIYSFTRITLAPILIVAGLVIEVYAIMKKEKA